MARDLVEVAKGNAAAAISSPALQALRRISLGTIQWPGQAERKYLSGGLTLTDEQRRQATALRDEIQAGLDSSGIPEATKARLAILAKMLMAFPAANATFDAARARGEAYLDALDDIPPWALQDAVRQWNRGEGDGNHDFAPSPARLRKICLGVLAPHGAALAHLNDLLNAWTHEDALDVSRQAPHNEMIPRLRAI